MSEEIEAHVVSRFEIVKKIGGGAYGHVWKVVDRKSRKTKALKKNFDAFNNNTDAQRTYREIMFLMELAHPNVIRLEEVIRAENNKDIYLLFEHMDIDLHTLVRENILAEKHRQFILYQMARALYYLHSAGLIHRDIKPANVLVNESCEARLCDFGLVRSLDDQDQDHSDILTEYIATRWYRAPEILLGSKKYSKAIDIWSFGCLLAEMQRGKPLFAGYSTMNQIEKVLMWTGLPSEAEVRGLRLSSGQEVFKLMSKLKRVAKRELLPKCSESCLDLISKCLEFDPQKRCTIEEIVAHPYLKEFYNKAELLEADGRIKVPVDDNQRLSLKEYRNIIYEDIRRKNKSVIEPNNSTLYRIKNVKKNLPRKNELIHDDRDKIAEAKTLSMGKAEDKTASIGKAEDSLRKKSVCKPAAIGKNKHLKTIEKEWDPLDGKLHAKDQQEFHTKYDWNRKKRSTTETNPKKTRMLPSPAELRKYH